MKMYNKPNTQVLPLCVNTRLMDGVVGSPGSKISGDDAPDQGGSVFAPRRL